MKKIVNIHIKGYKFIIEEDAFELLEKYLFELKNTLGKQQGADEIAEDIEIRIAELISSKKANTNEVIVIEDVQYALEILGNPSDYAEFEENDSENYIRSYKNY